VRAVVVDCGAAARRRGPVHAVPHGAVAAHGTRVVVRGGTAAGSVLRSRPDLTVTAQLGLGTVDGRTAAARVPSVFIFASSLPVATHGFVTVVEFARAATRAIAVVLSPDKTIGAADVAVVVVQQPAAAARGIAITQWSETFAAENLSAIVDDSVAAVRVVAILEWTRARLRRKA